MRAVRARLRGISALALVAVFASCDLGGPSGPAQVVGTVTGDSRLGAAVVELAWEGIAGFEGRGDTQVYAGAVAGAPDRYRVILVGPQGGDLRFTIDLADARLYGPVVHVVTAVGTDNQPLAVGDLRVVLER